MTNQQGAPEALNHIKEPYTLAEIKAKIASNDYGAEMLLQHAMLLLDSASLSANAGEPRALNPRHIRKFLQALQAGEMSVSRAVEILDAWVGGYYEDEMVPLPPPDSCLIADDEFPMEIVRKLRSELAAAPPTAQAEGRQARASLAASAGSEPVAGMNEYGVRGYLAATLKCWHRLTGDEAAELVAMTQRLSGLYLHPSPVGAKESAS